MSTSPTPPGPKGKRRGPILLAAAIGVALLVTTGFVANGGTPDSRPAPTPTTTTPAPAQPTRRMMDSAGIRGPRAGADTRAGARWRQSRSPS